MASGEYTLACSSASGRVLSRHVYSLQYSILHVPLPIMLSDISICMQVVEMWSISPRKYI